MENNSLFRRAGQAGELWPVFLLLLLVAVPTIAVLWFVGVAMKNQQLATQQQVSDAYRSHLQNVRRDIQAEWLSLLTKCDEISSQGIPPQAFREAVDTRLADALIVYDAGGAVSYPNSLTYSTADIERSGPDWQVAGKLENFSSLPLEAHDVYERIATEAEDERERVAAIQAQLRCLLTANKRTRASSLVNDHLVRHTFDSLEDHRAKSIAIKIQLMALEQFDSSSSKSKLRDSLAAWVKDYSDPYVASPQRLFVMKQLAGSHPGSIDQRLLRAESLAASFVSTSRSSSPATVVQSSNESEVWSALSPNEKCLVVLEQANLTSKLLQFASATTAPLVGAELHVLPPSRELEPKWFVSSSAGSHFPGWRLAFSLRDAEALETSSAERKRLLWTGCLVVLFTSVLAFFSARAFRRHLRLANFKNNLVGTVSHELKTPLSSMRLLVDTLLDEDKLDETTTREYLQLISKENQRLSRVIETFLTFSRMERGALALDFKSLDSRRIVDLAIESAGERFESDECRLTLSIEENLPPIRGDEDGLVTVLLNLLDNAYKYSQPVREIGVFAKKNPQSVAITVTDNGIGLSRSSKRRIFQRFYQVDRGLSRVGDGCGLGLSIVESIVSAHGGRIHVTSDLGKGSQFTIELPLANEVG